MKKFLLLLVLFPPFLQAQGPVEQFIDSLMSRRDNMPGSYLLIAKDGKPVIRKAYGLANLELSAPAKPEHLFTIASVSKQMVAVAVLQLAQQGKLSLEDDILTYFPKINTHGKTITIGHLLTHTSGLFSETGATGAKGRTLFEWAITHGVLSEEDFLQYMTEHDLFFDPGTDWGWNTYGYYTAFLIVEKVSGIPFNEYVRKNLFEPAGMTNSFSKVDGNRLGNFGIKNLVNTFYSPDADGKWIWRDFRRLTPIYFYERYAIVTCLDDLLKWNNALNEGKLLKKEWLDKARKPYMLQNGASTHYGYGWNLADYDHVTLIVSFGLGTNPICTVYVPERNLYVVYTQFYGSYENAEVIAKKIITRLLGLTYPTPEPAQAPLGDYVGVYDINRIGLRTTAQISDGPVYMNVTLERDTLYMQQSAAEKIAFRPAGKDRFLATGSDNTWYIFLRNDNGKVHGITTEGTLWTYGPGVLNKRVQVPWPQPVKPVAVNAVLLKKYSGTYYLTALDSYRFIETDGSKLYHKIAGVRQELIPVSNNKFVRKGVEDMVFEFKTNQSGDQMMTIKSLRSVDFKKVN